jgi:hypothetical protein
VNGQVEDARDTRSDDARSPVEWHVEQSFEDPEASAGRPLSRRARQTRRSVEAYLRAGGLPRYMERLREIEKELKEQRRRLEQAYRVLLDACGGDEQLFARRWRARVEAWPFDHVNELIRQHNDYYPIERGLPMDPRTRDYVKIRGRSYRREPVGPQWVLERFPERPRLDQPRLSAPIRSE